MVLAKPTRATSVAYLFILSLAIGVYYRTPNDCGSVPDDTKYMASKKQLIYIGDEVSKHIFERLPPLLPRWQLFHPANELRGACQSSNVGVTCTQRWLGKRHWDVVVFNFGLHDISQNFERVGGTQYQTNLRHIVQQIRAQCPNTTIFWVSTTPVSIDSLDLRPPRSYFDVIGYNGLAHDVMALEGVHVIHMHGIASTEKPFDDAEYTQMAQYMVSNLP